MAGTGYLRGLQDTRTPLAVAVGTSIVNLVVQLVLIYGFDLGIGASAASTVLAQTGGAAVYLRRVTPVGPLARRGARPRLGVDPSARAASAATSSSAPPRCAARCWSRPRS